MPTSFEHMTDEAASQMLLAYAQNRLNKDDRAKVDAEIATNVTLAEELAYYQGLAKAAAAQKSEASPNELGWARLTKAIDAEQNRVDDAPAAANDNTGFWRKACAALGLIAVVQGAFLGAAYFSPSHEESVYETATASTVAFESKVIFAPNATEADITMLLREVDGEIVNGPSALGAYTVRFNSGDERTAGLERFSNAANIVESADAP